MDLCTSSIGPSCFFDGSWLSAHPYSRLQWHGVYVFPGSTTSAAGGWTCSTVSTRRGIASDHCHVAAGTRKLEFLPQYKGVGPLPRADKVEAIYIYNVWRKLPFQQRRGPFRRNAQALTGRPNFLVQ
jgi:hypothetical protein